MSKQLRKLIDRLLDHYCRLFHSAISRPVNGRYRCWHCRREHLTNF